MKLKPIYDRLVIKVPERKEATKSGIIIPDTAGGNELVQVAEVVAVGEDAKEVVSVGDNIYFAQYGGDEIVVDGETYKVIKTTDILAILED